jgi:hypothetical protein
MKTMGCGARPESGGWRVKSVLVLMLPAMAWMGLGCAGDEALPEEALSTVSSAAASGCGWLRSGEQLRKGESVQSCNSRANLVHQTDGNVVEYDASGALWSTATYGKPTSHLVMQSDGNLVLYDTSGRALWHTATHGNPGAALAIQDDCNLVIYSTTGRVLWTNARQCRATPAGDLLPYFKNTRSQSLLGSDGSIVGFNQTQDGKTWWYRKWPGSSASNKFEKYTYDANYVYLIRDTTWSWRASNGAVYDSYDPIGLSFPLAKRNWPEGETFQFLSELKPFNVGTCSASSERPRHGWLRSIKYYPNYCWGNGTNGNIGCVDSIAISSAFLDNTRQPREVHWYAKNLGWVRYEEYDAAGTRTKDIYWTTMSSTSYPVSDVCQ